MEVSKGLVRLALRGQHLTLTESPEVPRARLRDPEDGMGFLRGGMGLPSPAGLIWLTHFRTAEKCNSKSALLDPVEYSSVQLTVGASTPLIHFPGSWKWARIWYQCQSCHCGSPTRAVEDPVSLPPIPCIFIKQDRSPIPEDALPRGMADQSSPEP